MSIVIQFFNAQQMRRTTSAYRPSLPAQPDGECSDTARSLVAPALQQDKRDTQKALDNIETARDAVPGAEATAKEACHHVLRHRLRFQVLQNGLHAEFPGKNQQQHQDRDPEKSLP